MGAWKVCPQCGYSGRKDPAKAGGQARQREDIRPINAGTENAFPLYVQSPASDVRKDGGQLVIEEKREKIAEARLKDTSQALF